MDNFILWLKSQQEKDWRENAILVIINSQFQKYNIEKKFTNFKENDNFSNWLIANPMTKNCNFNNKRVIKITILASKNCNSTINCWMIAILNSSYCNWNHNCSFKVKNKKDSVTTTTSILTKKKSHFLLWKIQFQQLKFINFAILGSRDYNYNN